MKVKSESEVAQPCPTLRNPMDCSPPGSSIHGNFQARALEWVAIAFSSLCLFMGAFIPFTFKITIDMYDLFGILVIVLDSFL